MIEEAIKLLAAKQNLTFEQSEAAVNEIMSGTVDGVKTAAFLVAMAMKGETVEEIAGAAAGMRAHATPVHYGKELLEIVGTGGDGSNTFNISTTSALVIAAGGVAVSKHGNRAASSKCGAADVLEALGVNIQQPPEKAVKLLDEVGICFFFAQLYHKAMKYVGPVRKELGIRTIFNILGPLTNPAHATHDLIGVYSEALVEPIAHVLDRLGVERGMVFHGNDGMDEISASAPTLVCELDHGKFKTYTIKPEDFGLSTGRKSDLVGGDAAENAEITRNIFAGKTEGVYQTRRNAVVLNAGAAFYIAGKAQTIEEGVKLAETIIDSGKAAEKLAQFARASQE